MLPIDVLFSPDVEQSFYNGVDFWMLFLSSLFFATVIIYYTRMAFKDRTTKQLDAAKVYLAADKSKRKKLLHTLHIKDRFLLFSKFHMTFSFLFVSMVSAMLLNLSLSVPSEIKGVDGTSGEINFFLNLVLIFLLIM